MLGRKELINLLAELAGPLGPFVLEDAPKDDALFFDWLERRSQEQFERIQDEAVEAFIDVVTHPPTVAEYVPPSRNEDFWSLELLDFASLYGRTPHAARILQGLDSALRSPGTRLLAIQVLGRLGGPAALARLRELASSELPKDELLWLVEAVAESGSVEARELLMSLRERFTDPEVRSAIDRELAALPK